MSAWSASEAPAMIESRESAFLGDGTGLVVSPHDRVTVIGHRYGDAERTMSCRIRGDG